MGFPLLEPGKREEKRKEAGEEKKKLSEIYINF